MIKWLCIYYVDGLNHFSNIDKMPQRIYTNIHSCLLLFVGKNQTVEYVTKIRTTNNKTLEPMENVCLFGKTYFLLEMGDLDGRMVSM